MAIATTLRDLSFDEARAAVAGGAAFVDLRRPQEYLDVHIPGSLCLGFEFGPGMASRARDCLPLDLALVLVDEPEIDAAHTAAALRGKGFDVLGVVRDALAEWGRAFGPPRSTEVITSVPEGATVLDVGDPGGRPPDDATRIPLEQLWIKTGELNAPIVVVAGAGVRAALAVGVLERAGIEEIAFLKT